MDILTTGIIELFGNDIALAFRRITEYLYFTWGMEVTQDHGAFIVALTIQAIALGVGLLMAILLIRWLTTLFEWGVNKFWIH